MIVVPGPVELPPPVTKFMRPPVFTDTKPAGSQAKPAAAVVRPPAEVAPRVVADNKVKPDDKPLAPVTKAVDPSLIESVGPEGPAVGDGDSRVGTTGPGTSKDSGTNKTVGPPAPFLTAEIMPEFLGGQEALQRYMQKNLRYPSLALRNNIEGRVYISFTVQADGSIADVQVLKGLGFGTDEEAARVVKNMPPWKPGMQNKHSVSVRYTMPITFRYD